jgi:hypothetical protein
MRIIPHRFSLDKFAGGVEWRELGSNPTTGTIEVKFNGTTSVYNITAQKIETILTLGSLTQTSTGCVKVSDSDVKSYGLIDTPTSEPTTQLSFPLSIGKTWIAYNYGQPSTAEVLTAENVSVPAGTFAAFKVNYPVTGICYQWYAKDVGLVKYALYDDDSELQILLELKSKNF